MSASFLTLPYVTQVLCYASKSEGMFVPESLIFRSDSNGEDLEGYAGERVARCPAPLDCSMRDCTCVADV